MKSSSGVPLPGIEVPHGYVYSQPQQYVQAQNYSKCPMESVDAMPQIQNNMFNMMPGQSYSKGEEIECKKKVFRKNSYDVDDID